MRIKIINYIKMHPFIVNILWKFAKFFLEVIGIFVKIDNKKIIFSSFGGRKFDDSPKALYDEICSNDNFKDYDLIWAFVEPNKFDIPRGRKIKIDTPKFFLELLKSKIWISNSGIDRGIKLNRKGVIKVETWHGTPLKKICGEENQNSMLAKSNKKKVIVDDNTIRCAQSEFDQRIFERVFNATQKSILICDLPRNDKLSHYTKKEINEIKEKLNIPIDKKIILYTPTYREYLVDKDLNTYIAPPINLNYWKDKLGDKYVLLMRAHYAVNKALNIQDNEFIKNVSDYPYLNDLYIISDIMISDYSSTYFDYSILERPMFCFAYDLEEYKEKRGLYLDLNKELPCRINKNEKELIEDIINMNYQEQKTKTVKFHNKYTPNAGSASKTIIKEILRRL